MKTNKWMYAIVIATFGWAACDDDDNILDKPNLNDTDETFVEVAARSNMAEIEFGEVAVSKATDPVVKTFAQEMIDQHKSAQDELKELADDFGGIEWPNDLDEGHDEVMERLNGAEAGYKFDSLYIATQVTAHQSAASVFQTATTNTTDARVKAYANKHLPKIEMHLEQANSIHTALIDDGTTDEDENN